MTLDTPRRLAVDVDGVRLAHEVERLAQLLVGDFAAVDVEPGEERLVQDAPAPPEPGTQPPATDPQPQPEESTPDYQKLYEQLQGQARKWETRAKANADKAKKWDQTEAANRSEAEQAVDRASQAESRAQAAITAAVNAEIRAAALGWANPADAPRYVDDKTKYVGEDGEIDTTAIAEDVAAVLTERPHLAAPTADKRRGPSPDPAQGARGTATVAEQVRDAEKRGDHREALRLKTANMLGGTR